MSEAEKNGGKFYMGGNNKDNYTKLILPTNPLEKEFEQARLEKESNEARELLLQLEREKQEELDKKLAKLEMIPIGNKIIILPYPRNPYKKILQGSIIIDYNGEFKNPDSGEQDKQKEFVSCAKIIEIGPDCKHLKVDDDIYYLPNTAFPIPFLSLGYQLTTEPQVLCVLNEGLKERFKMN